jgi:hypothetical protein
MRALIALLLLAGCDRLFNLDHFPDVRGDAAPDGARQVDAPPMGMLDAMADAPPVPCLPVGVACVGAVNAFPCDNLCFVTCDENVTQAVAVSRCNNSGGAKLAALDTATVDACVTSHLSEFSWTGYVQFPAQPFPDTAWYWLRGSSASPVYTHWKTNEPNDADGTETGQEDCAYVDNAGGWNDTPCTDSLAFVCER